MKRDRVLINSKGFSLIEVIVSVAILGIIALPLTMMFVSSVRQNEEAKRRMEAYQLANMLMEKIKQEKMLDETDRYEYYDAKLNLLPSAGGVVPSDARYRVDTRIIHNPNTDVVADGMSVPTADIIYDYSSETGDITDEIIIYEDHINVIEIKGPHAVDVTVTLELYNLKEQFSEQDSVTVFTSYDRSEHGNVVLVSKEGNFVLLNNLIPSPKSTKGMTMDEYDIIITVYDIKEKKVLVNLDSSHAMYSNP